MAYNILGINPFHNGSACILSDGKLISYIEEERLTRIKNDSNPFISIFNFIKAYKIDTIALGGLYHLKGKMSYTLNDPILEFIFKIFKNLKKTPVITYDYSKTHHKLHAYHAFHNSGFKKSLGIVIDGGGSRDLETHKEETTSIFLWDYPKLEIINSFYRDFNTDIPQLNVANFYTAITNYLGFGLNQEGKTMGLSSYGNKDNIKNTNYFKNYFLRPKYGIINDLPNTYMQDYYKLDSSYFPSLKDYKWHKDPNKLIKDICNLALETQEACQKNVGDLIEEYIDKTKITNVCCSGGYFLNCVNNYYLKKRFPNINFYFEPVSHDGGTSIGVALTHWYELKLNKSLQNKINSVYYGPQYSKEQLIEGIQKYV